MSRTENNDIQKEIKAAEKRGRRKGWFARIRSFIVGILCGFLILTLVTSYIHGLNAWNTFKTFFSREDPVAEHDLTLENHGIFGYAAADFAEAVLGKDQELKKLEVYSREVSDVATLTEAGIFRIKAFSKYQYITYHGTAVYTVDLSGLGKDDITLDDETKTVTMTVPAVVLEPINIPSDKIEFGSVEKNSVFAFGDIKLTPENQAKVETEARNKMLAKLEEDNVAADATAAAEHSIWEVFQPVISGVSPQYKLKIEFKEPLQNAAENSGNAAADVEGAAAGAEEAAGTAETEEAAE